MNDIQPVYRVLYVMDINPEPWTPGTAELGFKGRQRYAKITKDQRLIDYQEGIRTNIRSAYPDLEMYPESVRLHLIFKFWRQLDVYTKETGRKAQRHVADATNMTKALEDALQGVLYKNDRQVKYSEGEIMMEGPDVSPRILILARERLYPEFSWQKFANDLETRPRPDGSNVYYTTAAVL